MPAEGIAAPPMRCAKWPGARKRPWDMQMMNLQELLDEMDVFRKITGIRLQDIYNLMLRRGWTLGSAAAAAGDARRDPPLPSASRCKLLENYWQERSSRTWSFP